MSILGQLAPVELGGIWADEARNFTPWLSKDGLGVLGKAVGLDLQAHATEFSVGAYRADIVATVEGETDHLVIIENQLGQTDHRHLGQLMTYLAGVSNARTVIWISKSVQSDHRAAIDWLNANTIGTYAFFAVEIQLWQIGNSAPAPRFNVVCSPNNWARTVKAGSKAASEERLTPRHLARRAYWASFATYLDGQSSSFRIRRDCTENWFTFSIGRTGFGIAAAIVNDKQRIEVYLFCDIDPEKRWYAAFLHEKATIEEAFGEVLEWRELPEKKSWHVKSTLPDCDPWNDDNFPQMHAWMLDRMTRYKSVFQDRIRELPANSLVSLGVVTDDVTPVCDPEPVN